MKRVALLSVVILLSLISTRNAMAAATLTTLHIFSGTDGDAPVAPLVLASNGNFYGTTEFGGTNTSCISGCGTVFEISPDGTFASLYSFTSTNGQTPRAGLLQASDGNLYGTASSGGP